MPTEDRAPLYPPVSWTSISNEGLATFARSPVNRFQFSRGFVSGVFEKQLGFRYFSSILSSKDQSHGHECRSELYSFVPHLPTPGPHLSSAAFNGLRFPCQCKLFLAYLVRPPLCLRTLRLSPIFHRRVRAGPTPISGRISVKSELCFRYILYLLRLCSSGGAASAGAKGWKPQSIAAATA